MPSPKNTKSIDFPFRKGTESFPKMVVGAPAFIASVKSLLLTGKGEVPMLPNVGTNVHSFVHETMSPIKKSLLATEVRKVINENIKNVRILNIEVGDTASNGRVPILIVYSLNGETGKVELNM